MKRLVFLACLSLAVLVVPFTAAAQDTHADSPKVTLTLVQTMVVGTTTLPPGQYKFQCRTFDGKTFLVISALDSGKEITRVECVKEMLNAKVRESEIRSLVSADGKRTLTGVKIKGEMVSHRIVG